MLCAARPMLKMGFAHAPPPCAAVATAPCAEVNKQIKQLCSMDENEIFVFAKNIGAPLELVEEVREGSTRAWRGLSKRKTYQVCSFSGRLTMCFG